MKIKAAVLQAMGATSPYAVSRPLHIEEIDLAPPGPDEVLIKIAAAGLCHSDLSVINGDRPRPMPMALGHEAAGIVQELGAGVTDLQVGDHVVVVFVPSCGHCAPCAEGRPALCEPGAAANGAGTLLSGARRLTARGEVVNHHLGCSVFAEYATVSRRSVVKIDPTVPLDEAALFGCAVLTGVGAVVNTAQVRAGASVAVIGLGGVGLAALIGAHGGGRPANHRRRSVGRQAGAGAGPWRHAHGQRRPGADALEHIRELSSGGVEFAFEFAGSIRALDLAYNITRRGGIDRHRRPAAFDRALADARGQPGCRRANGEGQLHRHVRAVARHPALHRPVRAGPLAGRQAADRAA